ncbi:TRAP-type C4-dicarboxylate transport system periplasmic component [Vibrio maritimus]|uniref:TRAP-type C4-dicarboxylate transport system periplasmic component n=1 Tax=Vibrio maritimus TaxID=990268 RepID=A0A090T6M0_9VIBR|nr:TRAP-type C4-dicarboxylate transport system periplasmic component [Vibrio maritimus]
MHSAAGDKMLSKLNNMNLQGIGWMENGVRHVTNNSRPVETPEDLKGLKIRTMKFRRTSRHLTL